jgi:hypothetical protein
MPADASSNLPALEILDALDSDVPTERVEPTALILIARGVLHRGGQLRVRRDPGEHAKSDDLLRSLLDAADVGLVQRYRGAYRLTAAGRTALEELGGRASDSARAAAAELIRLEPSALWVQADRCPRP